MNCSSVSENFALLINTVKSVGGFCSWTLSGSPGAAIKTKHLSFEERVYFFSQFKQSSSKILMI